jgi:hypothetical protein
VPEPLRNALVLLALAVPAMAQPPTERHFEVAATAVSRYVFGGLTFSDEPVIHPSLKATAGGFELTAFGTWYTDTDELLEADLFLEYGTQRGRLALYGALSRYHFELEDGWSGTTEVYAGVGWDGPLQASLSITEDFDIGDGGLIELALAQALALGSQALGASLTLTYNRHYYSALSGLSHLELAVEMELPLGSRVRLRPRIAALQSLRDDVESAVYAGVGLAVGF